MIETKLPPKAVGTEQQDQIDEGGSRRGVLKQIVVAATTLGAAAFVSSKSLAQEKKAAAPKLPTESEILEQLKQEGITTLEGLVKKTAPTSNPSVQKWAFIAKGKFIIYDDSPSTRKTMNNWK